MALAAVLFCAGPASAQRRTKAKGAAGRTAKRSLAQLYFDSQTRADGKDTVFYIKGYAYSFIPGQRPQKLFGVDGYNIRRLIETPERDGYFVATREVVFYTDPATDQVLNEWQNPFTKQQDEVFHIANDPVNFRVRRKGDKFISVSLDGKREFGEAHQPQEWDDYLVWHSDIFPFYPLPNWERNYTAAELFDFYIPKSDLEHTKAPSVMVSWTRIGPWLPWMRMDGHEGLLVYHARSRRMETWDHLPEPIKLAVKEKFPLYLHAPETVDVTRPNATSWTYYAAEMKKRQGRQ